MLNLHHTALSLTSQQIGLFKKESKVLGTDESDPDPKPESSSGANLVSDPNYRTTGDPEALPGGSTIGTV